VIPKSLCDIGPTLVQTTFKPISKLWIKKLSCNTSSTLVGTTSFKVQKGIMITYARKKMKKDLCPHFN
jgi:hypothetical protein